MQCRATAPNKTTAGDDVTCWRRSPNPLRGGPFFSSQEEKGYNPGMTAGMYPKSGVPPHSKHKNPGSNPSLILSQEFLSGVFPRRGWCKQASFLAPDVASTMSIKASVRSFVKRLFRAPSVCNMAEGCPCSLLSH